MGPLSPHCLVLKLLLSHSYNLSFQGLKELADTEILAEAANTELEKNNLEQAQLMYTQLLKKFDGVIAPPYPVMGGGK